MDELPRLHWSVETRRLTWRERVIGFITLWVPPDRFCNERGCSNGAMKDGKCELCWERLWMRPVLRKE